MKERIKNEMQIQKKNQRTTKPNLLIKKSHSLKVIIEVDMYAYIYIIANKKKEVNH